MFQTRHKVFTYTSKRFEPFHVIENGKIDTLIIALSVLSIYGDLFFMAYGWFEFFM